MLSLRPPRFLPVVGGVILGLTGCVLFSSKVLATPLCDAAGYGICIPPVDCGGIDPITKRQETDKGELDCSSNGQLTCCVSSDPYVPTPDPVTCTSQGGNCMPTCLGGDIQVNTVQCSDSDLVCCKPPGLAAPATNSASAGPVAKPKSGGFLAGLSEKCTQSGDCEVEDIVQTGVTVATFFMGLAGAGFFFFFIYGGAMYLSSFGDAGRVKKGTEAIKGATIGIIIVMASWTIVRYIATTLARPGYFGSGSAAGTNAGDPCLNNGPGWSCQALQGKNTAEAMADGQSRGFDCQPQLCPAGGANVLCCKKK